MSEAVRNQSGVTFAAADPWAIPSGTRPPSRWSDLWKAPLHDLPVRDEILYQYLPLTAGMDVLEVGPGSGFTAFRLARQVRHLTLVDIAAQSIAHLGERLREIRNISLVCADVCAPGLATKLGRSFDAAYAIEVFELLPDPAECVRNFAAALRPGAPLLLQFPNYPPPKNPGFSYFSTRAELDRMFSDAGFQQWSVYSLRLRPVAQRIYQGLHERPLQLYRRWRSGEGKGKPLVYDQSWAFRHGRRLEIYKLALHAAWSTLLTGMRLGGPCFGHTLLGEEILNHNLLVLARR